MIITLEFPRSRAGLPSVRRKREGEYWAPSLGSEVLYSQVVTLKLLTSDMLKQATQSNTSGQY